MHGFKSYNSNSIANKEAIIKGNSYRFTVLFDGMIRMEYSADGIFEDRATKTVLNRCFSVPEFDVIETENSLEIITSKLHLYYDKKPFSYLGLRIDVEDYEWHFGCKVQNLYGTAKTLDGANGAIELEDGLVSRSGITVIDDSRTLVFEEDGWVTPLLNERQDIYFLYEKDPAKTLKYFYAVSGSVPMLPRFALGNWWSRWHAYSDTEYKELVEKFQEKNVPLSVAVLDIDWHHTHDLDPKYGSAWTGFSWNKKLFPNPRGFTDWLHQKGLHVTLNEHPRDGIRCFEDCYEKIADFMGKNKDLRETVEFDAADRKFMEGYFSCVLNPIEDEDGIDFWWTDWQQTGGVSKEGYEPLWMLNHYHFVNNARNGKRPLAFSRYSGLGSHRYPIGFSGDTHITWNNLEFQPYFTATATNVGYTWWSHDIGGFGAGARDDELQARWAQLGVFSPIMRLHSMNNISKEPWKLGMEYEYIVSNFLRLRHQLIPYLYTMNRKTAKDGTPLIRPMYHIYPQKNSAYSVPNQYFFGSELMVCPITSKIDALTRMGEITAWLPKGKWTDIFTGVTYEGGRSVKLFRRIDSIPVLARAGAIVPLTHKDYVMGGIESPENMEIKIFATDNGAFTLYEDNDMPEQTLKYAETEYKIIKTSGNCKFTIGAVSGEKSVVPEKRSYSLLFYALSDTDEISVTVDNRKVPFSKEYDGEKNILVISLSDIPADAHTEVCLVHTNEAQNNEREYAIDIMDYAYMEYDLKTEITTALDTAENKVMRLGIINTLVKDISLREALVEIYTAQTDDCMV